MKETIQSLGWFVWQCLQVITGLLYNIAESGIYYTVLNKVDVEGQAVVDPAQSQQHSRHWSVGQYRASKPGDEAIHSSIAGIVQRRDANKCLSDTQTYQVLDAAAWMIWRPVKSYPLVKVLGGALLSQRNPPMQYLAPVYKVAKG